MKQKIKGILGTYDASDLQLAMRVVLARAELRGVRALGQREIRDRWSAPVRAK